VLPAGLETQTSKPEIDYSHGEQEFRSETPKPISNISGNTTTRVTRNSSMRKPEKEMVEALYDFTAENEGELSISKGDKINVTDHIDEGWWYGENNGCKGLFPANYVRRVSSALNETKGRQSVRSVSNGSVTSTRKSVVQTSTNSTTKSCRACGCEEFNANVFKPNNCNNCFHEH
jgi:hypothetical protein